jgi:beta-lactamase class A
MNDRHQESYLERRLETYYDSSEQLPAPSVVWAKLAPSLRDRPAGDSHPPAVGSPSPTLRQRSVNRHTWQGITATAAGVVVVALFARVLSLALPAARPTGPTATPSATLPITKAPLDALSPDLAAYVAAQNGDMAVVVYDLTRNHYYSANETTPFVLASSAKVYIMVAYLDWVEGQGRAPKSDEIDSLTRMIENSTNDDAQLLYDRVGFDAGLRRFLQKIGITDYVSCPDGWGCAQLPPAAMAQILALLEEGLVLNAADRHLALDLLSHVEADQRWGIGDTAPPGATVYMKDGWLPYPTPGIWNLNSSGIVSTGSETYVLVVYTQNQPALDWSKVQYVARTVAQLLA